MDHNRQGEDLKVSYKSESGLSDALIASPEVGKGTRQVQKCKVKFSTTTNPKEKNQDLGYCPTKYNFTTKFTHTTLGCACGGCGACATLLLGRLECWCGLD